MTITAVLFIAALAAGPEEAWRVTAAHGPYFLCDDRVVADRWMAERFVVPLARHPGNPLITRDKPWEGTGPHMGGTVLRDPQDGLYKMWYSVWNSHAYYNKLPFSYNVCYAESEDGLTWNKPNLGVFEYEGSMENNCIRLGTDKTQNIDVCMNPLPDRYPGKYLAIHNQKGGVFVSSSEDGKTFTRLVEAPAISYHSDTHNNFVYDEVRDLWFLFCRPRTWAGDHRRRVSVQQSADLAQWTHETVILVPTETDLPEFYGMTVFRRGDLFFGGLQTYDRATGFMQAELAWSGDGYQWTQLPKHPSWVERGPEGAWDHGMAMIAESPVIEGETMRFYYGGFPLPHDTKEENVCAIGLMSAELDRLVGLRPSGTEPGLVLTRALDARGKRLVVNARVTGSIRVELRYGNNKTLEGWSFDDCDPLATTGFASEITWKGKSIGEVQETDVQILFKLDNAELYTFDLV
ncbi:MAG: hypothetical protein IT364_06255 [Candidatus Hydrogenedentes bacterium]|nr:hypothetical protein [Candidatus Hydrogenedentota bacterium]